MNMVRYDPFAGIGQLPCGLGQWIGSEMFVVCHCVHYQSIDTHAMRARSGVVRWSESWRILTCGPEMPAGGDPKKL